MSANPATWNDVRIETLKRCFQAGLSCSQIAREIGVTRNAVIGKMNRLGLSRPRNVIDGPLRHAARPARPKTARNLLRTAWRCKPAQPDVFAQHEMLTAAFPDARAEDVPIHNGRGCTLLELSPCQCRWPINTPGADDFRYCGNEPVKGLPYCLGHARIAYRPGGRRRASAQG